MDFSGGLEKGFFVGPVWAALTGFATLITALFPVFAWLLPVGRVGAGTLISDRSVSGSMTRVGSCTRSRPGCGRVLLASTLNFVVMNLYTILVFGLAMTAVSSSETLFTLYKNTMDTCRSNLMRYSLWTCSSSCFGVLVWLLMLVVSSVASLRKGYAKGAYFALLLSVAYSWLFALAGTLAYGGMLLYLVYLLGSALAFLIVGLSIKWTESAYLSSVSYHDI